SVTSSRLAKAEGDTFSRLAEIDRAAHAFQLVAAEYEDGRPGYAADVVAGAIAELDLGPGSIVLDLGAGTGKLTRMLLDAELAVIAIDPSPAMLAQLRAAAPRGGGGGGGGPPGGGGGRGGARGSGFPLVRREGCAGRDSSCPQPGWGRRAALEPPRPRRPGATAARRADRSARAHLAARAAARHAARDCRDGPVRARLAVRIPASAADRPARPGRSPTLEQLRGRTATRPTRDP